MKVLISSNAPYAGTGYGQQTLLLAKQLAGHGHEPAVSCFYGLQGSLLTWDGIPLYPAYLDPYGNDVLLPHAQHYFGSARGGLVITLVDAWVLNVGVLKELNAACWAPVDHQPIPPQVRNVLADSWCWPLAMSRYGETEMRNAGLNPLYFPHAVDTGKFFPRDRGECRDKFGIPRDAFVVGMVAANKGYPPRKGFPQALEAFARFHQSHPDSLLYLHTEPEGKVQGIHLPSLLNAVGIPPEAVRFSEPYTAQVLGSPVEMMADLYSMFDVLVNPAYGEGFGVPILEAQACGTPVIVGGWTAMSEVGGVGWHVEGDRTFTDQRAFMWIPRPDSILGALEDAYGKAGSLTDDCVKHAAAYDVNQVWDKYWGPAIAELESRVSPLPLPA